MEESLANIQITKDATNFLVRIQTGIGGMREYKSKRMEDLLQQMVLDLQDEFDTAL